MGCLSKTCERPHDLVVVPATRDGMTSRSRVFLHSPSDQTRLVRRSQGQQLSVNSEECPAALSPPVSEPLNKPTLRLERHPTRLNRQGFPNRRRSDSSCRPGMEAGADGNSSVDGPEIACAGGDRRRGVLSSGGGALRRQPCQRDLLGAI